MVGGYKIAHANAIFLQNSMLLRNIELCVNGSYDRNSCARLEIIWCKDKCGRQWLPIKIGGFKYTDIWQALKIVVPETLF